MDFSLSLCPRTHSFLNWYFNKRQCNGLQNIYYNSLYYRVPLCACALHIDRVRAERQDGLKHFRCFFFCIIFCVRCFFCRFVSIICNSVILPVKHISQPSWSPCSICPYPYNIGYVECTTQQEHFQCSNICIVCDSVWFFISFVFSLFH